MQAIAIYMISLFRFLCKIDLRVIENGKVVIFLLTGFCGGIIKGLVGFVKNNPFW